MASALNFIDYENVETDPNVSHIQNVIVEVENEKIDVEKESKSRGYHLIEHQVTLEDDLF